MTAAHEAIHAMLRNLCRTAGAVAWGVADAQPTDEADATLYASWLSRGMHGPLAYMERHPELRRDPRLLLDGARSVLVCAFSARQRVHSPHIADFALGSDYHDVLRARMRAVGQGISDALGGDTRVCVDSAPLRERYWAVRAGVGRTGRNGRLMVPGIGSDVLLAVLLTQAQLPPSTPLQPAAMPECRTCRRCVEACPAGALDGRGGVDARRCLACLTIELRGPLPEGTDLHGRLAGCDICARVCPAAEACRPPLPLPELQPRPQVLAMTPARAAELTQAEFSAIFAGSPVKRLKLDGLQRNARAITQQKPKTQQQ